MSREWKIVIPEGDGGAPYPWNWVAVDGNVYRQSWWRAVQAGQTVRWTREDVRGGLLVSVFVVETAASEWAAKNDGAAKEWSFDHRGLCARLVPQEYWGEVSINLEVGLTAAVA